MNYLRNAWYQAAWSHELDESGPIARTIVEIPLVLFRGGHGKAAALYDRCPHRFAPLSKGQFEGGTVTCGYHGLAFDAEGQCTRNPHGPILRSMRVVSYPVIERHDAIWVWPGDPDKANSTALVDLRFIDETPASAKLYGHMPTAANYQLLSDNILDLSHADYLHPSTLGGIMSGAKTTVEQRGDTLVVRWLTDGVEPPPAFKPIVPVGKADIWTEVVWSPPAVMVLNTGAVPTGAARSDEDQSYTLHNMTPETTTTTHYFYCSTRRFLRDDLRFTQLLKRVMDQAFVGEDKPMVEAQQARMATSDLFSLEPLLLSIDAGAVRARRMLDRMVASEISVG